MSDRNTTTSQLAALDLGSNSFHLLIALEDRGRIQVIDKYKEMVRLGEGLTSTNHLDPVVEHRAIQCLERMSERLRSVDSGSVRVVGTNTLRQLSKNNQFVTLAEQVLGHPIEIISGREEARLIYSGVSHDLGDNTRRQLVIDIGGGSTELIVGENFAPQTLESLHMGCVSMTNKHFKNNPSLEEAFLNAIVDALVELEPIAQTYRQAGWNQVVGASGTINGVVSVQNAMDLGTQITHGSLRAIRREIIRLSDVSLLPGLGVARADVFAGGLAILIAIFETFDITSMEASQSALREGVILDLVGRKRDSDIRDHTVSDLCIRFNVDAGQASRVKQTATNFFDQIKGDWGLDIKARRRLLGWAANLHEIGMDISHNKYHRHGSYLLSYMDMPGFSRTEQAQIAILVGMHRRRLNPETFENGPPWIIKLGVLLRLAAVIHRHRDTTIDTSMRVFDDTECEPAGIQLSIDKTYLERHPLTELDLESEVELLASIGVRFRLKAKT